MCLGVEKANLSIGVCNWKAIFIFTNMNTINTLVSYFQKNRVLRHLVFWVAMLFLNLPKGIIGHGNDPLYVILIMFGSILIAQIFTSYYFAYFVIPKFLLKRKYIDAVLLFIIGTYIFSAFGRIMIVHVGETLVRKPPFTQEPILEILTDWRKLLISYVPSIYSVALIFLFAKYFLEYRKIKERDLSLSKEKSEAELKTLKAQLNPHFLFNTLNNIYSLSVINSPKTSTSISKLSEILDHVLYRCNGTYVLLSSEVELLKNFIELEKLRYDERLQVSLSEDIENDTEIPPLILLSLVENAFKHGAGEDSGSPKIDIHISNNQKEFIFKISNTISKEYQLNIKENIGLSNVRKQLDLICGNTYELNIIPSEKKFTVTLKINQE